MILLRRLPNLQVCFSPLLFSHYFQWTIHKSFWKISARFDCWVPSDVYQLFEKSDISLLPLVVQFLKLRIINCLGIKEMEEDECTYCLVTFASSLFPHSLFCQGKSHSGMFADISAYVLSASGLIWLFLCDSLILNVSLPSSIFNAKRQLDLVFFLLIKTVVRKREVSIWSISMLFQHILISYRNNNKET